MSEDLTSKLPANGNQTLSRVLNALQELTVRVDKLDQKVEERLYDTRPIWEQVVNSVGQLQEGQARLQSELQSVQEGQARLERGQDQLQQTQQRMQSELQNLHDGQERLTPDSREVKTYLRDILRRMSIFHDTLLTIQADYRDIYDRIRGLEQKGEANG